VQECVEAALKLHAYLVGSHWNGAALVGPDVGIRFNWRIGRFIKSYLPGIRWNDSYCYLQAQGYWVLANWKLFQRTGDEFYRDIALRAAGHILEQQRLDGAWDYPNPEWRGRVATAEGTWGSLGLLDTFRHSGDVRYLDGALRWHRYLVDEIGFEQNGDELSVNYFSKAATARVPNNSAFVLRFLSELAELTRDQTYLNPCRGLVSFMSLAQKPNGEFPYMVKGRVGRTKCWEHFQCYQYNAFQSLDLMRYHELTGDRAVPPVISRCLEFLRGGLADDGEVYYDCHNRYRRVSYHAGALGAAFANAEPLGFGSHKQQAEKAFSYLFRAQTPNGSYPFSRGDYYALSDKRSYPRVLAMILFHFLNWLERFPQRSKVCE
jgi:hypothetical protein